jgi:hypothetical protein
MTSTVSRLAQRACACAMVLGCAGHQGDGAENDTRPTLCSENVVASDESNYAFSSTITLAPVPVAPMSNLVFDWSGLTRDFMGHDLAPAKDLGLAMVMFWALPLEEFERQLNADELFTADLIVSPPLSLPLSGATSAHLYDFTINTTPVTPEMINPYFDAAAYPPSRATFIAGVQAGDALGRNLRMMQAFNLDASSSATVVPITNDSMKLAYSVNLHDLKTTVVPAGDPGLTLDWSHMNVDGFGRRFTRGNVTDAIVGHYAGTPAELEKKFLDLDQIALKTYRAAIPSGLVLDFKTLKDDSGASFTGIDGTGTWLVGLLCGNCRNPAPLYMTILKPCST